MFVTVKVKSAIFCAVLAAAVALGCIMLTMGAGEQTAVPRLGRTIVLDAGHGGIDGGVTGTETGTPEAQINLGVVKSLAHLLRKNGYDVVLTRTDDGGLYDEHAPNLKRSDMERRRQVIEEAAPDLVVSVHQNYYPRPSVSGAQVFFAPGSESASETAETMQRALNSALGGTRTAAEGDYYIVKCTSYPSVIVECGFLSNPEEERRLVTAAYQEKVAYVLFGAIHSVFGGSERG